MQQEEKVRRHLGHIVRKLDNVLKRNMELAMMSWEIDELTASNSWIIAYLHRNRDRSVYQRDVEAEFSVGRSAVTAVLTRMEEKGFLVRESDPTDARLKRLLLTPKGEELFCRIHKTIEWVNEQQTAGLAAEELEQCFRTLKKIARNGEELNARMSGPDKHWITEMTQRKENEA